MTPPASSIASWARCHRSRKRSHDSDLECKAFGYLSGHTSPYFCVHNGRNDDRPLRRALRSKSLWWTKADMACSNKMIDSAPSRLKNTCFDASQDTRSSQSSVWIDCRYHQHWASLVQIYQHTAFSGGQKTMSRVEGLV